MVTLRSSGKKLDAVVLPDKLSRLAPKSPGRGAGKGKTTVKIPPGLKRSPNHPISRHSHPHVKGGSVRGPVRAPDKAARNKKLAAESQQIFGASTPSRKGSFTRSGTNSFERSNSGAGGRTTPPAKAAARKSNGPTASPLLLPSFRHVTPNRKAGAKAKPQAAKKVATKGKAKAKAPVKVKAKAKSVGAHKSPTRSFAAKAAQASSGAKSPGGSKSPVLQRMPSVANLRKSLSGLSSGDSVFRGSRSSSVSPRHHKEEGGILSTLFGWLGLGQ